MTFHIPFAIFLLACGLYLGTLIGTASYEAEALGRHLANLEIQAETLTDNQKQLAGLKKEREKMLANSDEIQRQYRDLFTDLLALAKEDAETMAVVKKWNIRQN